MLTSDEPRAAAPSADPELLIKEARHRQYRRRKQRGVFLFAAVALAGFALAVTQLTRGGRGPKAAQPPPSVAAAPGSHHAVIYEKFQVIWATPHRPQMRAVLRSWTDSELGPWRETVVGRPALEYGEGYMYDGHTRAIYLTSAGFPAARAPLPTPRVLRRLLGSQGYHAAGKRRYAGRTVFAFTRSVPHTVLYVDAQTYIPVFWNVSFAVPGKPHVHILERAIVWRVLPANRANLKLTSPAASHPGTRIVPERAIMVGRSLGLPIYDTEPQHVRGLPAAFESPPIFPLVLFPWNLSGSLVDGWGR